MATTTVDYYAALGLKKSATAADIKRAYRELTRYYHPDSVGEVGGYDGPDRKDKLTAVTDAYDVLGNATKRAKYDAKRQSERGEVDADEIAAWTPEQSDLLAQQLRASAQAGESVTARGRVFAIELVTVRKDGVDSLQPVVTCNGDVLESVDGELVDRESATPAMHTAFAEAQISVVDLFKKAANYRVALGPEAETLRLELGAHAAVNTGADRWESREFECQVGDEVEIHPALTLNGRCLEPLPGTPIGVTFASISDYETLSDSEGTVRAAIKELYSLRSQISAAAGQLHNSGDAAGDGCFIDGIRYELKPVIWQTTDFKGEPRHWQANKLCSDDMSLEVLPPGATPVSAEALTLDLDRFRRYQADSGQLSRYFHDLHEWRRRAAEKAREITEFLEVTDAFPAGDGVDYGLIEGGSRWGLKNILLRRNDAILSAMNVTLSDDVRDQFRPPTKQECQDFLEGEADHLLTYFKPLIKSRKPSLLQDLKGGFGRVESPKPKQGEQQQDAQPKRRRLFGKFLGN